jgi:hypothetical protein
MKLLFPHTLSRFNGLPHLSRRTIEPPKIADPAPSYAGESHGLLHARLTSSEPDLTQALGWAPGSWPARHAGDRL